MNNTIKLTNKGYSEDVRQTYDRGLQGQDFIEQRFLGKGYSVYRRNFKKIGVEIDLILYRYISDTGVLIVRIIEVKTRNGVYLHRYIDLDSFQIDRKWLKIKKYVYGIVSDIKRELGVMSAKHVIHFDMALVAFDSTCSQGEDMYRLYRYFEDVDLLI